MEIELQTIKIQVVLVLYCLAPEQSSAFLTLSDLISALGMASSFACMVYDNSPTAHDLPATTFPCEYRHDPSNPGLALPYQAALESAARTETPWLLLLDQDTVLTADYLSKLLESARAFKERREIAAIVPRLVQDEAVLSPHLPHGTATTHSFRDRSGLLESNVCVYNSASLLRVEALEHNGGFPQDFALDYLDHAVFRRLHDGGGRVFLLPTTLKHNLAGKAQDIVKALKESARLRSVLAAEGRFYRQYGSRADRLRLVRRRTMLAFRMLLRLELRSLVALLRPMNRTLGRGA